MKIIEGPSRPIVGYTGDAPQNPPRGGSSGRHPVERIIHVHEVKITWRTAILLFAASTLTSMLSGLFWFLVTK